MTIDESGTLDRKAHHMSDKMVRIAALQTDCITAEVRASVSAALVVVHIVAISVLIFVDKMLLPMVVIVGFLVVLLGVMMVQGRQADKFRRKLRLLGEASSSEL